MCKEVLQGSVMILTPKSFVAKSDDQMEANLGAETLMMRVESGQYFSVDETAHTIWGMIDGPTPVSAIIRTLLERYDVDPETCERQTLSFLDDLLTQKLIFRHPGLGA